jgi:hypothetical protein
MTAQKVRVRLLKLREAKFFLELAGQTNPTDERWGYYVSAFLSAARAFGSCAGKAYGAWVAAQDPGDAALLRALNDERNRDAHASGPSFGWVAVVAPRCPHSWEERRDDGYIHTVKPDCGCPDFSGRYRTMRVNDEPANVLERGRELLALLQRAADELQLAEQSSAPPNDKMQRTSHS